MRFIKAVARKFFHQIKNERCSFRLHIAQSLAGYSLGAADLLRRAMGKKKPEEMAIQREIFCAGAIERDVEPREYPARLCAICMTCS